MWRPLVWLLLQLAVSFSICLCVEDFNISCNGDFKLSKLMSFSKFIQ